MSGRLRFAPSPTGLIHVGNARTALVNWLLARATGARLLLRLDDTDRERCRPEHVAALEQDLAWLGLDFDERFTQSDRLALYAAAADRLREAGRLYPCFEGEEELRAKREALIRRGRPPVYDRAMLSLTAAQRAAAEANGKRPYWRFRLSDGAVAWEDRVLGRREIGLATLSDPVLVRADGTPLYTLTSVVDDLDWRTTLVLRGEDHVTNTAVQLDIAAALGGRLAFAHLPLLLDAGGGKVSKRGGEGAGGHAGRALTLRGLARDGVEPTALAACLAALGTGQEPVARPLSALAEGFSLRGIGRAPARFDMARLLAVNARALRETPFEAVRARLPPAATAAFWRAVRGNLELLGEARGWWEVVAGEIVPPDMGEEADYLRAAEAALPAEPWDDTVWPRWTAALRERTGRGGRALFHPLRLALTGEENGPEMQRLLPLIGRVRATERLRMAAG